MRYKRQLLIVSLAVIGTIAIAVIGYRQLRADNYVTYLVGHCLTYQSSVGGQGSDGDVRRCDSWAREFHAEKGQQVEFCIDEFRNVDGCIRNSTFRLPPWPLGVRTPDDAADCSQVQCYNF